MCGIRKCAMEKGFETCGSCPDLDRYQSVKMVLDNSVDAKGESWEIKQGITRSCR